MSGYRPGQRGGNDSWCTPPEMLDLVRLCSPTGEIDLDPCSNPYSQVGAKRSISLEEGGDGLAVAWRGFVFVNPPYSRIGPWIDKALASAGSATTLILVPPSTASWFHRVMAGPTVAVALRGRVAFLKDGVPVVGNNKGSILFLVGGGHEDRKRLLRVFNSLGTPLVEYGAVA